MFAMLTKLSPMDSDFLAAILELDSSDAREMLAVKFGLRDLPDCSRKEQVARRSVLESMTSELTH